MSATARMPAIGSKARPDRAGPSRPFVACESPINRRYPIIGLAYHRESTHTRWTRWMGEIRDLVGIFGAIDRTAAADSHVREAVGRLLPLYRRSDVRWFDDFEAWTKELRPEESDTPPFPTSLDEA